MRFVEAYVRRPHLILSLVLLMAVVGVVGYFQIPVNLFPDSDRPQIAVVTVWPGVSADDVSSDVSRVVEKELKTIELEVYKVSSATPAVITLALTPKEGSHLDLSMIRQLADNPIKEAILRVHGVGNVEVFGGYQPVVRVTLDPDRLQAFRPTAGQVASALGTWNRNTPEGMVVTDATHVPLKSQGAFTRPG